MTNEEVIIKTREHVKGLFETESSGHDWSHIWRVRNLALRIGKEEGADLFVVELAALLHDIADWKMHNDDEEIGPRTAREWLLDLELSEEIAEKVAKIIYLISFKGAKVEDKQDDMPLEGKVVRDADRLDAMGAIGVARTFAFGVHIKRKMHDPAVSPLMHASAEEYSNQQSTTINHFYEKLLLLKDRMVTESAKKIAAERHAYMEEFLDRFKKEWEGEL